MRRIPTIAAFAIAMTAASLALVSPAFAQRPDQRLDQPLVQSLNWFAFVGADDIRQTCRPGGRSQIRLIYNALWEEQVRIYELFLQPDGTAGLAIRVIANQSPANNIVIYSLNDVSGPWSTHKTDRILTVAETSGLMASLQASSAFGPPRDGLRLPDNDFWWTVASCRNGIWGFQAYHYPTDHFANAQFIARLFALDSVKVPINKPRNLEPAELRRDFLAPVNRGRADRWMLVVGKDGLRPR
jgi:hypothetical protein